MTSLPPAAAAASDAPSHARPRTLNDIGIDIGGTFTDVVMVGADGTLRVTKGLSTPDDQSKGAVATVAQLDTPFAGLRTIIHGTTVATNAILERRGARLAVVATRGFRDMLELQRQERRNIWDLYIRKVTPLAPRQMRLEIDERIGADGAVVTALTDAALAALVQEIGALAPEAVAICLLNAHANPDHEARIEAHLHAAFPGLYITRSSRVAPHFREYERASTTATSAFVGPKLAHYLDRFGARFAERGFAGGIYVMGSNGGVLPIDRTARHPATTCLSGPAGGVLATQRLAREKGVGNLISFDMGGTSTDVCVITGGEASISTAFEIDGLPITLPMFAIHTVSAGGGSIAAIDRGGLLQVGPESAGADPGPACYGRGGTQPTVTDALCVLGLIRPEGFAGGALQLSPEAAEAAFAPVCAALGAGPAAAAAMTLRIANARMANAVRLAAVRDGCDPRDHALVAFGGAGPLHACHVAEDIGIDHVIVPRFPGAFSALGLLSASIRRDFVRAFPGRAGTLAPGALRAALEGMRADAAPEMATLAAGRPVSWAFAADLRYAGQASELLVPATADATAESLAGAFHALHRAKYGYDEPEAEVEVVNLRLTGRVALEAASFPPVAPGDGGAARETRPSRLPGAPQVTFCDRDSLGLGDAMAGPALVSEPTATTFVPPGWRLSVDAQGHLDLRRQPGPAES